MIFWNNIIDNNNIEVIYLMEPLNVPYNQEIIILEDICNSKGIHLKSYQKYTGNVIEAKWKSKEDHLEVQ